MSRSLLQSNQLSELEILRIAAQEEGNWEKKYEYAERLWTIVDSTKFDETTYLAKKVEISNYLYQIITNEQGRLSTYANDANSLLGVISAKEQKYHDAINFFNAVKFDPINPLPFFEAQNQLALIHLNKNSGHYNHLHAMSAYAKAAQAKQKTKVKLNEDLELMLRNAAEYVRIEEDKSTLAFAFPQASPNNLDYAYKINRLGYHFGFISLEQYQNELIKIISSTTSPTKLQVKAYYQLIITSIKHAQTTRDSSAITDYLDRAITYAQRFKASNNLNTLGKKAQIILKLLPKLEATKNAGVISNPDQFLQAFNSYRDQIHDSTLFTMQVVAILLTVLTYLFFPVLVFLPSVLTYFWYVAFHTNQNTNPKPGIVDFMLNWSAGFVATRLAAALGEVLTHAFILMGSSLAFIGKAIYDLVTNNVSNIQDRLDIVLKTPVQISKSTYVGLQDSLRSVTDPTQVTQMTLEPKVGVDGIFSENFIHQLFHPMEKNEKFDDQSFTGNNNNNSNNDSNNNPSSNNDSYQPEAVVNLAAFNH